MTLFESEIGGDKPIHDAWEPDVLVHSMGFRSLKIGISHSMRPFETLGEKVVKLIRFRAGGGFEVTETLVCVSAVVMLND